MKADVDLQRDVLAELDWEPSVDAAQIGVTAKEGVATLTGHVPVYAEKHAAEEAAKRVHGVKAVANEIEVRPSGSGQPDDADIAAAAVHALKWNTRVPADRVQVTVQEGWVTLEGTVDQQYEKTAAYRAVHHLMGVRGVTNSIRVEPGQRAGELKAAIEAAYRRSATLNSKKISVETDDGTVILSGDVHSHAQLEEAERTAWAAPGVASVENCITVTPWGYGPAEEWGY